MRIRQAKRNLLWFSYINYFLDILCQMLNIVGPHVPLNFQRFIMYLPEMGSNTYVFVFESI